MKIRNLMLSALILGAMAAPAFAGPVIDWDPAYVYGLGASRGSPAPPGVTVAPATCTRG